jgi:threonine/homoserine/homoserine lactone efflux protein
MLGSRPHGDDRRRRSGLIRLFDARPIAYTILSLTYLVWLAWRRATAARPEGSSSRARPMTFFEAAAFQWINPKACAMALTAITLHAPSRSLAAIGLVALVFGAINLPSISAWTEAGRGLRPLLDRPARLRMFNWTMAAPLLAAALHML